MFLRTKSGVIKKVGFYETEKKTKNWHRYADIIIPLVTLPLLLIIGLYFHHYISEKFNQENDKWTVFALSSFLLIISFIVFVYICIRLSAVLGGRTRLRLPMIRSNRSNACFMKSVNSDLQYITPLNTCPRSYESIIFDLPPYHNSTKKITGQGAEGCITI